MVAASSIRRAAVLMTLLLSALLPVAAGELAGAAQARGASSSQLVAFRGDFVRFGGRRSFGGFSSGRGHPILRHVVHTLIWISILHLLFSHGVISLLIWIVIIGLIVSIFRMFRRRRYAY